MAGMNNIIFITLLFFYGCNTTNAASADEWRKRVIYQILTDRFSPDVETPECTDLRSWCGGTYQGIIQRLDYIKNLGADAIWISPMVLNTEGGYHGYWAKDIYQIEDHFGTEDDLMDLIDACHEKDMFIMLDVVPNHMGYPPGCDWNPCSEEKLTNFTEFIPFDDPDHYHTLCAIEDFDNQAQVENCRLANLPDLNQTVPYVRSILLDWIRNTTLVYGFDGYRIDTARHISLDFWPEYQSAAGMYTLGEVAKDLVDYTAQYQGPLTSVLNFPLYYTLRRIFNEGILDFNDLKTNLEEQNEHFLDTTILGTFIDNHDQPRFLNLSSDVTLFKNALTYIFFAQGVPIIYYGTEQMFSGGGDPDNRESLWPHYDEDTQIYQFIQAMLAFRKANIDSVTLTEQHVCYADADSFAFTRNSSKLLVYITRVGSGHNIQANFNLSTEDGSVYQNILDASDTITVTDGAVMISVDDGEPRVYVMTGQADDGVGSIRNTGLVMTILCLFTQFLLT